MSNTGQESIHKKLQHSLQHISTNLVKTAEKLRNAEENYKQAANKLFSVS